MATAALAANLGYKVSLLAWNENESFPTFFLIFASARRAISVSNPCVLFCQHMVLQFLSWYVALIFQHVALAALSRHVNWPCQHMVLVLKSFVNARCKFLLQASFAFVMRTGIVFIIMNP